MATNKTSDTKAKKVAKSKPLTERKPATWTKPFRAFGGYFKGSWQELQQVRWPDRRASWSLTVAIILFSLFFALVIVGLDYVFSYLFKEVLL